MATLCEVQENFRNFGHLTLVRAPMGTRYHVHPDQVDEFNSEVEAIEEAIQLYKSNRTPVSTVNDLYLAFQTKWASHQTSL